MNDVDKGRWGLFGSTECCDAPHSVGAYCKDEKEHAHGCSSRKLPGPDGDPELAFRPLARVLARGYTLADQDRVNPGAPQRRGSRVFLLTGRAPSGRFAKFDHRCVVLEAG